MAKTTRVDPEHPPYFFLSYARIDKQKDKPVLRTFDAICEHLMHLTDFPDDQKVSVGFIDQGMRTGTDWSKEVMLALSLCRVFVPLLCDRYFASDFCGKELDAFMRRELEHRGPDRDSTLHAVVPVWWSPPDDQRLPKAVAALQTYDFDMSDQYHRVGLYGLTSISNRESEFGEATWNIAYEIKRTARDTELPPGKVRTPEELRNVFLDEEEQ
ncbi:TIR-like protein FxsC [Nonomuraea fuscirosea]|uniref:TIR-like protein FxsC n=1 Tax=Nonomuraea fuscirosea TaxID=1291556 RepID=UPI002DDC044D|nr:TIR-like protein FxsC [Nonomuraea fuscirosea]WSA51530.1 TIR-like protein FxsC [Nonomuraea fuscirosea]